MASTYKECASTQYIIPICIRVRAANIPPLKNPNLAIKVFVSVSRSFISDLNCIENDESVMCKCETMSQTHVS